MITTLTPDVVVPCKEEMDRVWSHLQETYPVLKEYGYHVVPRKMHNVIQPLVDVFFEMTEMTEMTETENGE